MDGFGKIVAIATYFVVLCALLPWIEKKIIFYHEDLPFHLNFFINYGFSPLVYLIVSPSLSTIMGA